MQAVKHRLHIIFCGRPSVYLQIVYASAMLLSHFLYAREVFSKLQLLPSVAWWHEYA